MTVYAYRCDGCDRQEEVLRTMASPPAWSRPCPACNSGTLRRTFGKIQILNTTNDLPNTHAGGNIALGVRTPAQQNAHYGKVIERLRKLAREGAAAGKPWRLIGSVPREHYNARMRQCGKDYWAEDPKKTLKREGYNNFD